MSRGISTPTVTAAIRAAIDASGLSKREIGRRLSPDGDRRSQVQKWYTGRSGITPENAAALEAALGIQAGTIETVVRAEAALHAAERLEKEFADRRAELLHRLSGDERKRP